MSEFSEGVTAPTTVDVGDGTQTGEPTSYLQDFVGDGKKYKTIEEAAEALAKKAVNADKHIETLLGEKQTLEQQYQEVSARARSVDEILAAIRETEYKPPTDSATATAAPSIDDIVAQIDARNEQTKKQHEKSQRIQDAWTLLGSPEVFGDEAAAKAAVAKYINGDENRKQLVNTMAVADPKGLVRLLKEPVVPVTFMDPAENGRQIRSDDIPSGALTWDVVKHVRKTNPKLYESKAFKQRMHTEL